MTKFFISDFHFGHKNSAIQRNFESVDAMDTHIIKCFNSVVSEKDTTYFLGDFCFNNQSIEFLEQLNGLFYFIKGNHDQKVLKHKKIQYWVDGYYDIKINNQKITLCHFPMTSWECSHYGAWHLHGHLHGKISFEGKILDVCCETLNYKPISFEELTIVMANKRDNWDLIKK